MYYKFNIQTQLLDLFIYCIIPFIVPSAILSLTRAHGLRPVGVRGVPRVFDETLFRIFAKHEIHENAPVFREIFASFASFARSNFRDFRVSRKL